MNGLLRLVVDNPDASSRVRHDRAALQRLADHLANEIRAGHMSGARRTVAREALTPIGIAAVATWLLRAGVDEDEILAVIA